MFDGDKRCNLCDADISPGQRKFGVTLSGHTHVFCDSCFRTRKKDLERLLNEEG